MNTKIENPQIKSNETGTEVYPKQTIKLLLAYDGTSYSGWQMQKNGLTIQEVLQDKLNILLKEKITVIGAGRTDAGVHALGQVGHFHIDKEIDCFKLRASLNGLLPYDIRVKEVATAPPGFHARYSAYNKVYHYHLLLSPVQDPFRRLYNWQITDKLNLDHLKEAASYFLGTHDFTSFANEALHGAAGKNPIRTLKRLEIIVEEEELRFEFEAESFLYKMVRNITGTLIEVAKGKRHPDEISAILKAKDRRRSGKAAPAKGLFLKRIDYPQEPV